MASKEIKFEFVLANPTNPKPGKSSQIRSRCMQGKNKREGSRRTQREKKKVAKEIAAGIIPYRSQELSSTLSPRCILDEYAPIRFDGRGIDSEAKRLLFKAFAYNIADRKMTPLDRCVNLDCLESASFGWLFSDTAYLHSVLCASYAINDFMAPQWDGTPGRKTVFHLRETLSLLRVKMQDEYVYQDESVLRVIINLTLLAAVFGDWMAVAAHFAGLHKIVHLRGNAVFLKARPTLHFKLDRIDLACSLSSGRRPYFVQPTASWDSIIAMPYSPLPTNLYQPPSSWDFRLANVFQDFQYLTLKINRNKLKFVIYNPACFQGDLTSVQSRLMHLSDMLDSPLEKLVRLTILSMLTTTFRIPGRKIPYDWVNEQLRENYEAAGNALRQDTSLLLWVIVTAAITVASPHEKWIKEAWASHGAGLDWATVKTHLMKVMWIEIVHDRPGEAVCQQLEESRLLENVCYEPLSYSQHLFGF